MRMPGLLLGTLLASALTVPVASAAARVPPCAALPTLDDRCELWVGTWDNPDGHTGSGPLSAAAGQDQPAAMVLSPSGDRAYVAGLSWSQAGGADLAVVAFSGASGSVMWTAREGGPRGLRDTLTAIAIDPGGARLFVTGFQDFRVCGLEICADLVTLSLDAATGAIRWSASYDGPAGLDDRGRGVAVSPDGARVFVTGGSQGRDSGDEAGGATDYLTIAYDAATGVELWRAVLDGPGGGTDEAQAVAVSPDGRRVMVTGQAEPPGPGSDGDFDVLTVAYDSGSEDTPADERGGKLLWSDVYSGEAFFDDAVDLEISPDGSRAYVVGQAGSVQSFTSDLLTLAYDVPTGARAWLRRYAGPFGDYSTGYDVALSPSGDRIFVTGLTTSEEGSSDRDMVTLAYTEAGTQLWERRYDVNTYENGYSVAVSPAGDTVYVTGITVPYLPIQAAYGYDAVTVAYAAGTGVPRWTALFNTSPALADFTYGLRAAVTPSGRLLVAAEFYYSSVDWVAGPLHYQNYEDIGLLAYDP